MRLLSFDTETTSPKPATARVVQVAAISEGEYYLPERPIDIVMNQLCNPGVDITDGAFKVHGISQEMVKNAPPDLEAMLALYEYMEQHQDSLILAGHNAITFDLPILWRLARKPPLRIPVIDTMVCAQRTLPHAENHKLGGLTEWLKLGSAEAAHDALADIRMVSNLVEYFCRVLNKNWVQLAEWCGQPRVLTVCHFGKFKGRPWGKGSGCVPKGYARFVAENFDPSPDLKATLRHHYNLRMAKAA